MNSIYSQFAAEHAECLAQSSPTPTAPQSVIDKCVTEVATVLHVRDGIDPAALVDVINLIWSLSQ